MSEVTTHTFEEAIPLINDKYLTLLNELIEKFKYHEELIGPLEYDLKITNDKLPENKYQVVSTITDNLLYCFEQIYDHNSDYFIYQKDKVQKKSGKTYKNKLPKIGNKTLLKKVLKELDTNSSEKLFKNIIDIFNFLIVKNEDIYSFNEEYVSYVKTLFNDNKNFSKMIMVIDNINSILNSKLEEVENPIDLDDDEEEVKETKNKSNKKKNKSKKNGGMGSDFMKGVENTKIAQLAKNISEKINMEDFPALTDPTKLLSSLTNPTGEDNGIQNLLKFVIGEVEGAFKSNNLNETDLINEAQSIMGQFTNMSGFDPMSMLKGNGKDFNMNQFADIFANMSKK
jgi:hypothetical protein